MTEAKASGFMRPETHNQTWQCEYGVNGNALQELLIFAVDAIRLIEYMLMGFSSLDGV
jgi:hypothetical protein